VGVHGNIVLYPSGIREVADVEMTARQVLRVLENFGMTRPGVSEAAQPTGDCSATFEELFEEGELPEHVHFVVQPEEVNPKLRELVYVLPEDSDDLELPFIEVTVAATQMPLIDPMSGDELAQTVAAIEFSYEDVRLSEEIHRLRDAEHPLLAGLSGVFASPIRCAIVAY
jgi:hypothetical protein